LNLCKVEKNFNLLPNFWYIKDSNVTSGAKKRKIFEKGTNFFGHPVLQALFIRKENAYSEVRGGTRCI
jgi:hypothetical protein